jgi:sodium-dependent dicarboxylate transporter 2/3/5
MFDLIKRLALFTGPAFCLLVLLLVDLDSENPAVTATAAIAIWMAIWWITEAVPLAVTALIPLVFFPLLGVMNGKAVSSAYINHIIFLFIGGFLMAIAMQKWNLHRRIALRILMAFGRGPGSILMGFMFTTALLSMWISNTATAMMMVPVVLAVILNIEETIKDEKTRQKLATGLLLAIAYSASIGGIATLIGTPPNLTFARILAISFPAAPEISFANWLVFALPLTLVMLGVAWLVLYMLYIRHSKGVALDRKYFRQQHNALGLASFEQKATGIAFTLMALLWIFRSDIRLGSINIPGWSQLFPNPSFINDGTVAIGIALLLFLIPAKQEKGNLLGSDAWTKLPWHIILLFGGGFALASGFIESGLSAWLANQLSVMQGYHPFMVIIGICFLVTFLTELSSNTATTEMFLPVLAAMAVAFELNPLLLMIPATLSASFAFMLPVATPPNAILFGTNRLHVYEMARAGIFLNIFGVMVISLAAWFWAPTIFDFSRNILPEWAVLAQH